MSIRRVSWKRNLDAGFKGALWIVAMVLLADGIAEQVFRLEEGVGRLFPVAVILICLISVSCIPLFLILKSREDQRAVHIALVMMAVSLVCRLVWIFFIDAYPVNDFQYYLQFGSEVAANGHPEWSRFGTGVYWRRTSFYTYPIILLFGQSLLAVKLVNVLLITLSGWFFFLAARILHGVRTAAIGLVFFLWIPDLWYCVTLSAHDVPGVFWLSVFMLICADLQRWLTSAQVSRFSKLRIAALAIGLGGTLFFLDVSRSYQIPAMAALALYVLIYSSVLIFKRSGDPDDDTSVRKGLFSPASTRIPRLKLAAANALWLFILPLGVYRVADWGFWRAWHVAEADVSVSSMCYYTMINVLGVNEYDETGIWYENQCPQIKSGERNAFALRKFLHDLTHDPVQSVLHFERKNRRLSGVDDYLEWSTYANPDVQDVFSGQVRRINKWWVTEQRGAVSLAHFAILLLVLGRFLLYPRIGFNTSEFVMLVFSGILFAVILFILESQPRYDIFLAFPFSWMAAQTIEYLHGVHSRGNLPARNETGITGPRLASCGLVVLFFLGAIGWGASILVADGYLTLRDQSNFSAVPRNVLGDELRQYPVADPVFVKNNFKQLMLGFTPGISLERNSIAAVQRTFAIKARNNHHLRFFLSTSEARRGPFVDAVGWVKADFQYYILVNNQIIAQGDLNAIRDDRYFSFNWAAQAPFEPQVTLRLILRNLKEIDRIAADSGPVVALEYIDLQ